VDIYDQTFRPSGECAKVRHGFRSYGDTAFNLDSHVVAVAEKKLLHFLDCIGCVSHARSRSRPSRGDVSAVVDPSEVVLTATVAMPEKIEVVASQPIHLLNNPMISALASVLKCKLKPTTAADVSAFTSSLSVFTANTVNR